VWCAEDGAEFGNRRSIVQSGQHRGISGYDHTSVCTNSKQGGRQRTDDIGESTSFDERI
jgi:hypothetical protein